MVNPNKKNKAGNRPELSGAIAVLMLLGVMVSCSGQNPSPFTPGTLAGEERTIDLGSGVTMNLVWCPPGKFPRQSATVHISKGFWIGQTEVTQEQWVQVMKSNPSHFKGPLRPVDYLSWTDCLKFSKNFKKLAPLPKGWKYTLPTEAQWEYACRAGTTTVYHFGNDVALLHDYAWFVENSGRTTHPVGGKNPNAWGIHDMSGNVAEWCLDWFGTYPTGSVTDPVGPRSGDFRVFRGSSFGSQPGFSNCAERGSATPDHLYDFLGFRVVAVAE